MFSEADRSLNKYRRVDSDIEDDPPTGVEAMTLPLIELLTTLMTKGSVRPVVEQGLVPLVTTISSYMILSR